MNADFWNERYREAGFAYGALPNVYFADKLEVLAPGSVLLPAEGEGRQAVYAALQGWQVMAFDPSESGYRKAISLAAENGQTITYRICDAHAFLEGNAQLFDAVAFIYSHFPDSDRIELHHRLAQMVRPGGHVVMEVFAKGHTDYNSRDPRVGGPRDTSMLFSEDEAAYIFSDFDILEMITQEVTLNEGKYHVGTGLVLRVFGRRKMIHSSERAR